MNTEESLFKGFKLHIGTRIIKSAVAASISMLIVAQAGLDFSSLAVVAAVITLQPTFHETLDMAKKRIIGALIGTILAIPFVYLIKANPAFEVFIGVVVILALSNSLSLSGSSILGVIAYVSIVVTPDATYVTMFDRIVNTLIGVGTSIVINLLTPVQPVAEKTENIMNRALMHDIKLLTESIRALLGEETLKQGDLGRLTDQIIAELTEAYNAGASLRREQRYSFDTESYRVFDEKYHALWVIHNCTLQIQIDKDTYVENGFELPEKTAAKLKDLTGLLAGISDSETVPAGTKSKIEPLVAALEKTLEDIFSKIGDAPEAGSFYIVLLSNLKRFSDNIVFFEAKN